jgi:hypothetical protein
MSEAFTPTPCPSPGECDPPQEGVEPGEGGGFVGGGGPSAPRLLEFLPLSATLGCVDGNLTAERPLGCAPRSAPLGSGGFARAGGEADGLAKCEGLLHRTSETGH